MIKASKIIVTCVACIICLFNVQAKTINSDSIDNVLKTLKDNSAKVDSLIQAGNLCFYILPGKAFDYYQKAIVLAQKINYQYGLAWAYFAKGTYYLYVTKGTKIGLNYYHSADSIFHKYNGHKFKEGAAAVLSNYGALYHQQGNYLEAIQFYIKAARTFDSINNKKLLPRTYANISTLYSYLEQFDKAEFYARQVIKIAEETNDSYHISLGSLRLALALISQEKYEKVFSHIQKAKKIAETNSEHSILSSCYSSLGTYYAYHKKDYNQAINNMKKAIELAKLSGNSLGEANHTTSLGEFYLTYNQFTEAKRCAQKAYELSYMFNFISAEQQALDILSKTEAHSGEYKKAYDHLFQATILKDSIFKDKNQRQINYLGALYQAEKKENEIIQLQNEKQINALTIKRRTVTIYALFITVALLIVVSLLFYRNIHNKRIIIAQELQLERQKIKELEKVHQLEAAHAVLKGEEKERGRLSRDLHDGLGGMLSVIKLKLSGIKGNRILDQEGVLQFDHAIDLLDDSIKELRRVSHNMMPEALMKFGLKDALRDFCDQISAGKKSGVIFNYFGESKRIENSLEIAIYRIVLELVNNALKHADAKEILVQVVQEDTRIHLTVMDNGKGFDLSQVNTTKSSGLRNIRARVESLNGHMDIDTKPGKGTEIGVEFALV